MPSVSVSMEPPVDFESFAKTPEFVQYRDERIAMILSQYVNASIWFRGLQELRQKATMPSSNRVGHADMPRRTNLPEEVHRTSARLADGRLKFYFSLRGRKGTGFWSSFEKMPRTAEFFSAYANAMAKAKPKASVISTSDVIAEFFASANFKKKKLRTQSDYRRWLNRFNEEFGPDPMKMWEIPSSRREVDKWRSKWMASPKQYDYAATVVSLFLNWAKKEAYVENHFCEGLEKLYEVDRSEIVWSPDDIRKVEAIAPLWVQRILFAATETGLRVGDLVKLSRNQIEQTPSGRRIRVKTSKRGIPAYIPVTHRMGRLIDETANEQLLILTNASNLPLTTHRASEGLRQWRDKAGLGPETIGYELRLNDARGTAATRLLREGLSLAQIAACMGWSLRTAAAMIERYAKVSPEETDEVLHILQRAKQNGS
ncbi:hypothetical protein DSM109990_00837 [Sulfitobacter dubius]|uniref:Tyr recombinase domain-containing protein n=1 Tax=Sulfitobacter dubius TaxID=218673 RepID=A0ABY3ZHB8_9RHOB|nr:hypothetical protein DSM109990_00837 [Sulfitobacter dubius]